MPSRWLVKVGGSLCDPQLLPSIAYAIQRLASTRAIVVVPGGGPFAELVRNWDDRIALTPTAAHWMAIAAMNQYGFLLESVGMGRPVEDFKSIDVVEGSTIFLPYEYLRATDSLPRSWSITSDSIAALIAQRLKADRVVLLKSTDAALSSSCRVEEAVQRGLVDTSFAHYLNHACRCWVVNGRNPEQLLGFSKGECAGTEIVARQPEFDASHTGIRS